MLFLVLHIEESKYSS